MRRPILFLLTLLLALAVAGVAPAAAWAEDGDESGDDNAAIAINTQNGASIFDFAFSIRRVASDVVDQTNTAVAFNQCEECRAVAVAIQIVLVVGQPSVVTPGNLAVSVNYECTLCESLAMAYQFVIGVPEDFHFSGDAMSDIKQIRNEIRKLMKEEGLSIDELRRRIDALADRLRVIIREDIRRHEERAKRQRDEDERRRGPPPQPPPTTVPTTTEKETTTTEETTTAETESTPTTTTTSTTTTP
jgi:hypothetical protein